MTRTFEFPELPGLSTDLRRDLVKRSRQRHVSQGSVVFTPGAPVDAMLILLSGTLRVEQVAQSGGNRALRSTRKNSILTAACLLADATYAATGIAETDLDLMSLPKAAFDDLMSGSQEFRGLIFQAYAKRITDLMQVVEEVAFRRIEHPIGGTPGRPLPGSGEKIVATQQPDGNRTRNRARGHFASNWANFSGLVGWRSDVVMCACADEGSPQEPSIFGSCGPCVTRSQTSLRRQRYQQ